MRRTTLLPTLLLIIASAHAQDWTGAINSDWNNPGNWTDWPLDGENITIDSSNYAGAMADPVISTASVFVPDRVFILDGSLTISANLAVADRFIVEGEGRVHLNGGALTTDRLIADVGGLFVISNGTATVTSVLAIADGSADRPSTFEQSGGAVNVIGELGFECEAGANSPTYQMSDGSLTVGGDALWFGQSPGSGRGALKVTGGNVEFHGNVANAAGSTIDLHIDQSGGNITTLGPLVELTNATDSIRITAGSMHFGGNLEIRNDGVLRSDPGDVYFDQQAELRGSGTYRFHNVTISAGATLQHTDPVEIEVAAAWINMGTFDPDGNTIAFTGQGMALVSGGNFHGMRVANSGTGVQVVGTCTVAGMLTMEQGLVHTQANDLLVLLHGATSTDGSDNSHVNGPMMKIGNSDFVFPVGNNGQWRRIGISGINDQDTEFTAQYIALPPSNTALLGPDLFTVSTLEHWTLARTGTVDNAHVKLFWEDASASGLPACNTLVTAFWDGTLWQGTGSTTTGSCIGNDAGTVQTNDPLATFDVLTFGASSGSIGMAEITLRSGPSATPLPASEVVTFTGVGGMGGARVIDSQGRTMNATFEHNTLDVRSWVPGTYTLVVEGRAARFMVAH